MKVVKRDASLADFDKRKIETAILKSMKNGSGIVKPDIAAKIADEIEAECSENDEDEIDISEIEAKVFDKLISKKQRLTAKSYEGYRRIREFQRESQNTTDQQIRELLDGTSDYWNNENSNKNSRLLTTQRDYMAGIISTDLTRRYLLSPEIVQAHDDGIAHYHDADYNGMNAITNCCLINLDDMLQNGTCINKVKIEKPHRLLTAMTIATQIITAVTSSQYGGATITLTHLAPFVRESRKRLFEKYVNRGMFTKDIDKFVEQDLREEITAAVQTFNYQCNSMTTTNGQSPFLSVFMYLGETNEYKEELAMLIEEFLRQRIQGMKNEAGVYVTQAFPKLLYVLEEGNIHENSKYYYLTKLAAQCTAKRMVPDYISEKVMKELKDGNTYPCMGCVQGDEVITYKFKNHLYVESFKRMWRRMSDHFPVKSQNQIIFDPDHLYMDVDEVAIYDTEHGFVETKRIIRNKTDKWLSIKFEHGRSIMCTLDHPFPTQAGRKMAKDLSTKDVIRINSYQYNEEKTVFNPEKAWLLGFMLCDGCYDKHVTSSIAYESENDIQEAYIERAEKFFENEVKVVERHRGAKGKYKDLYSTGNVSESIGYLANKFEGISKLARHIPNEVFEWDRTAKISFMAGMIDADGYINSTPKGGSVVQIGSTNKELALQQAALARAIGCPAVVYQNHYSKRIPDAIRWRVEFAPLPELLEYIVSEKKKSNYVANTTNYHYNFAAVNEIKEIEKSEYSYDVTTTSDFFEVSGIYSHNCRSFLTVYHDENGKSKFYGRFNQGVVTLNLPDIALSSGGDMDEFWRIFDERTELCHKALKARHERLEGTKSDVAPILWQDGAFARLEKGEVIDELLHNGYSTLSLGYAGLYECVKYITGHSHTDGGIGEAFGLEVMSRLNDKCKEWKEAENIDYSLYGSPIESTTYKFAKCLQKRFGIIPGITDKNYVTNSYHVPVFEKIDPFKKLEIESKFQKLSPGGAISYIECTDLTKNTEAVLEIIKYIYDHIMYAELNTKSDYCQVCGYDGEIKIIDENGELIWECPNCHNRDKSKMNVTRRTCGLKIM